VKTTRFVAFGLSILVPVLAGAQDVSRVKTLFEAGRYDDVAQSASAQRERNPAAFATAFLAAQSYLKMNRPDSAQAELSWIEEQGDEVWSPIAQSGRALAGGNAGEAVRKASEAVERGPDNFYAHYQLGLAYSQAGDLDKAAAAFERAAQIDPSCAYAHYYAGLAYNKLRRVDLMAAHFEAFLNQAPSAPERPAVESIMRTIRGR
jgi:tetratricopeptide (TPR) repeat protein